MAHFIDPRLLSLNDLAVIAGNAFPGKVRVMFKTGWRGWESMKGNVR